MINFCVSLTSLPSRIDDIKKTIDSIQNQTLKPNKIFLNLPHRFKRFLSYEFSKKQLLDLEKFNIEINRCDDYGPSTKLMGSLKKIKDFECVIILDDDHIYQKEIFEIFISEYKKKKSNYSYYVQKVFELNMGQGADCILIETKNLDKIENFYQSHVKNNINLFLNDDLWISLYLQFIAKNKILDLSNIYKQKTNKELVYKIHTNIDSLKDTMNKGIINRRKIAKLEYLRFKIKNYFNNFFQ
jgi:hypothetical protein